MGNLFPLLADPSLFLYKFCIILQLAPHWGALLLSFIEKFEASRGAWGKVSLRRKYPNDQCQFFFFRSSEMRHFYTKLLERGLATAEWRCQRRWRRRRRRWCWRRCQNNRRCRKKCSLAKNYSLRATIWGHHSNTLQLQLHITFIRKASLARWRLTRATGMSPAKDQISILLQLLKGAV